MLRAFVAIAVLAKATNASRIVEQAKSNLAAESTFFESCADLQDIFRSRVTAVQSFLDTQQNETGTVARARGTMRVFGVVRTLRRAKDCQWVLDGDSEDIEQSRSVVQAVLAENPCAEAAMAEMTPEAFETAAYELQPLQRAMIVLMSESCEVPEQEEGEEIAGPENEAAMDDRLGEEEEEVQDHIDELFEQAALDSESMAGGSFVQTEAKARWGLGFVLGMIGAVFFGLLVALLCIPVGAVIGAIIGLVFCIMGVGIDLCGHSGHFIGLGVGGMVGSAVTFAGCAQFLVQELMPRDFSNAPHQQASIPLM